MQKQLKSIIVQCTEFLKDNGFSSEANQMCCKSLGIAVPAYRKPGGGTHLRSSPFMSFIGSPPSRLPPAHPANVTSKCHKPLWPSADCQQSLVHPYTQARRTLQDECTVATTLLKVREWRHREGKELSEVVHCSDCPRWSIAWDLNPGSLTLELKLLIRQPGILLEETLYLCENT